jgi:beta-galactosidase
MVDFDIIKDIGSNCVRLSHYQQSQAAYDYADQNGLVLWTEIPLINNISTSKAFADNCAHQLTELIRQNFNHPSVFFWGLYNEITLIKGPNSDELVRALNRLAHQEDSSRLTTCAVNGDNEKAVNWISEVNSFNVYDGWYGGKLEGFAAWADDVHASYPKRGVGVSEWGAGANPTHHQEPPVHPKTDGPFHPEEYQNILHETYWLAMKTRPFLWWKSLWNAFDFASDCRHEGGTPGMNDKGLTTYDRKTHKDAYYWYKANWSTSPVCYITSRRYTPRTVSPVQIKVYSNCDKVEVKVNGVSLGSLTSPDRRFIWKDMVLKVSENKIEAIGWKGERTYSDSCTWVYDNGTLKRDSDPQ